MSTIKPITPKTPISPYVDRYMAGIEQQEPWAVSTPRTEKKLAQLRAALEEVKVTKRIDECIEKIIKINSQCHFSESIALLQSLDAKNAIMLQDILSRGLSGKDDTLDWQIQTERLGWLTRVSTIYRVFSPERTAWIMKAIKSRRIRNARRES